MSNIIKVKEERNALSFEEGETSIVANSTNFYLQFKLDEDWAECEIITAIFDMDGVRHYEELDENYMCQIPATNSGKILFYLTSEPAADKKLSSTVLSLSVEESGDTNLESSPNYKAARNALLTLIEQLQAGEIQASLAAYATKAGGSETQVSLTGDEVITGEKNFTGTLKSNSVVVPNAMQIVNPNLVVNGDFLVSARGSGIGIGTRDGVDMYPIDRWGLFNNNGKFNRMDKSLKGLDENGPVMMCQWIENADTLLYGKTITVSALINSVRRSKTLTLPSSYTADYVENIYEGDDCVFRIYVNKTKKRLGVQFLVENGVTVYLDEIKLELSDFRTRYHAKNYAEEQLLCQRYYQRIKVCAVGYGQNTQKIIFQVPLPTTMVSSKTITVQTAPKVFRDGVEFATVNPSLYQTDANGIIMRVETAGDGDVVAGGLYFMTGGVFEIDGEIY